jgi:hypothetical protein
MENRITNIRHLILLAFGAGLCAAPAQAQSYCSSVTVIDPLPGPWSETAMATVGA